MNQQLAATTKLESAWDIWVSRNLGDAFGEMTRKHARQNITLIPLSLTPESTRLDSAHEAYTEKQYFLPARQLDC